MPKNIYTQRDDLVCGKIDKAFEIAQSIGSVELVELLGAIQYDCQRMENALVRRKESIERLIKEKLEMDKAICYFIDEVIHHRVVLRQNNEVRISLPDHYREHYHELFDDVFNGNDYTDYRISSPLDSGNIERTRLAQVSRGSNTIKTCLECGRKYHTKK
jgi:hypothetical protein